MARGQSEPPAAERGGRLASGTPPGGRRDATSSPTAGRDTAVRRRRHPAVAFPTRGETATLLSVPTVLLAVHFLVRPSVDAWSRLGYVRLPAARTVPPGRIAPASLGADPWWWHGVTRVSHVLVHDPAGYHAHAVGNVVLLGVAAWCLLAFLSGLGRRRWFAFVYWELAVVAPLVGSYAFDLWGSTPRGYGASTIGYAFLGVVLVTGLCVLGSSVRPCRDRPAGSSARPGGGVGFHPLAVTCILVVVFGVVTVDLLQASGATPVHQAGVAFGVLVGSVVAVAG